METTNLTENLLHRTTTTDFTQDFDKQAYGINAKIEKKGDYSLDSSKNQALPHLKGHTLRNETGNFQENIIFEESGSKSGASNKRTEKARTVEGNFKQESSYISTKDGVFKQREENYTGKVSRKYINDRLAEANESGNYSHNETTQASKAYKDKGWATTESYLENRLGEGNRLVKQVNIIFTICLMFRTAMQDLQKKQKLIC